jgi:hypothetical protein
LQNTTVQKLWFSHRNKAHINEAKFTSAAGYPSGDMAFGYVTGVELGESQKLLLWDISAHGIRWITRLPTAALCWFGKYPATASNRVFISPQLASSGNHCSVPES